MPKTPYTSEELECLLKGILQDKLLSELASGLERSLEGIVHKLRDLSSQDPQTWDPEKSKNYGCALYREGKREWARAHYQKNKSKIRVKKRRNYSSEQRRNRYVKHQEERRAWQRSYRETHRDEVNERRRRIEALREFKDLGSLLHMGYPIVAVEIEEDSLRLTMRERRGNIDQTQVEDDFYAAMRELPYRVCCNIRYEKQILTLRPIDQRDYPVQRTRRFLFALENALQKDLESRR